MNADGAPQHYVLGHTDQELARLERQGELFGVETRDVLRRAGVKTGMRVLDVGCGIGDVSMIAAEMVGPTGSVLGIDNAAAALPVGRDRAHRSGHDWLSFAEADLHEFEATVKYDAVIGRFILMHIADPVAVIARFSRVLDHDAIIAFIEMDIDQSVAVPEMPLLAQCIKWIDATYRKVGAEPNMGSKLYATFRAAGFTPRLTGTCRIESGPDSIAYEFAAQTLSSLLPAMEKLGIATADEIGVATLADRLRADAIAGDHCILMPRLIGAWAANPATR